MEKEGANRKLILALPITARWGRSSPFLTPVEVRAKNDLDDEMIRRGGCAPSRTEVDFPLRGNKKIDDRKDLVLLVVQIDEVSELAPVPVILDPKVVNRLRLICEG